MPKHLPLVLIVTACFAGCATPDAPVFINKNARIVERNLAPEEDPPQVVAQPKVERSLAGPAVAPVAPVVARPAAAPVQAAPAQTAVTTQTAAQPVAAAPVAQVAGGRWEVRVSDVRLASTFERWAAESAAGGRDAYKILWDADKHVLIDATPVYGGSILDAVEAALSTPSIRRSAYPLEACLYPNSPPLIRITKRGEQTEACPDVK